MHPMPEYVRITLKTKTTFTGPDLHAVFELVRCLNLFPLIRITYLYLSEDNKGSAEMLCRDDFDKGPASLDEIEKGLWLGMCHFILPYYYICPMTRIKIFQAICQRP